MKQYFTAKKVLVIHWRGSNINKESRKLRKEKFKENWMVLDLFQFAILEDPSYEDWKVTFDKIDFSKYDSIYTNSLWWAMTTKYILENDIKVKRVIFSVPWRWKYLDYTRKNLFEFYNELYSNNIHLSNNVDELVVLSIKDDDIVPFENWKEFANKIWADFIELEKWWHKLEWHLELIISLVKYWNNKLKEWKA